MKKSTFLVVFLLCRLLVLSGSESRNYYFTIIDGESGLSQNNIKAIIQDSWGFMWFGSRNRLNRYDGTAIKVFDCNDPDAKRRNNNISALFEDKNKKLWVGTDKGVFLYDPFTESFTFLNVKTSSGIKIEDWVADIQSDTDNNIWIVAPSQGLFRYQMHDKKLYRYLLGKASDPGQGSPQTLCMEQNGKVWVGTYGAGVFLYDKRSDSFTQMLGDQNGKTLKGENIFTLCDYGNELVIGIHEGTLWKLNKLKNTIQEVNAPEIHHKIIRHVVCFDNKLWVGTESGMYIIDELKKAVVHIHEDPMFAHALSDNLIVKIYKDKENGLWIGTNFGGVNYLPDRGISFEQHVPLSTPGSISSKRIRELKEDDQGNIWIGTEDAGLNILDPKTTIFKRLGSSPGSNPTYQKILGISFLKNQAWVGLFKNGLNVIQLPQLNTKHYSARQLGLNEESVSAICEDKSGKVWIGNTMGVFVAEKNQMNFRPVKTFGSSFIYDLMEDSDGYIWAATMGSGVYRYNPKNGLIRHFVNEAENPASLSSNSVSDVMEDSKGQLWFSTDRGGICMFNKKTGKFCTFSIKDGLPDDVAYKIVEDRQHDLWFGTNKGLVRFNPQTKGIRVYTKRDGLPGNQFNYKSALATKSGKLYFGGLQGLIAFNPIEFRKNRIIPSVFITRLTLFDKEVPISPEHSPLKRSIIHTQKITLKHDQSNIGFTFVALSYNAPSANRYAYKMEGIDKSWIYTTNSHSASYVKLPPGKYTFTVKGTNNDGLWNEKGAHIDIVILPPWWQSNIAYMLYFLTVLFLLYYCFGWYKRKNEKQNAENFRLFEAEKEKELYNAKMEFFTNIVHEIRTPLTLINGPLESMQEMNITDPEIKKNLHIMDRSAAQLLKLINQLLDFRKVDSKKLGLTFSMLNISEVVKDIITQFEPVANRKKKKIQAAFPVNAIVAPVDKNEFNKILNNLLTNALKYSKENIGIRLGKKGSNFTIQVWNDGELIPEEFHEKIFEPFFQLKKDKGHASSSGIGLSLVRSLVELHNGHIHLDTKSGVNNFILELPLEQKNAIQIKETPIDRSVTQTEESSIPQEIEKAGTVLVVEDEPEILSFITDQLQKVFIVEQATSGREALEILDVENVDIIVSDVMMSGMDGFELCRQLKSTIEYSHIPIVLLTAKNDLASKIQGLELGAEAYIEKPFSPSYLITQLNTLLNNRKRERDAFMQKPFLPIQQMGMNKADEKFMDKIIEIIKENITDLLFSVDKLAEALHMSRSNMHRKIKALSGLTPNDFIRLIRLKMAAELIQEGEYRIGEVCFLVGINSASYFSKLFQKQFGMTPKEFEKQQHS